MCFRLTAIAATVACCGRTLTVVVTTRAGTIITVAIFALAVCASAAFVSGGFSAHNTPRKVQKMVNQGEIPIFTSLITRLRVNSCNN